LPVPIAAQRVYCLPVETSRAGSVTTTEAAGASWPIRTAVECSPVAGPFPVGPEVNSGTTEAAAQIPDKATLPEFLTTRTTETRSVGGRTEVELEGGSWVVVVVVDVEVVVVDVVEVVEEVVAPGIVVGVVVVVDVVVVLEVVVVGGVVVVVGSPLIRTTGGCKVRATITRSSWASSLGKVESCATHVTAEESTHDEGEWTHLEAGRRPL
jgi:hypothetical protein